ncbi:MAG: DUF262 domain-containing protein [Flavobacteriales bacterium]
MRYEITTIKIKDLIDLIKNNQIDLKPYYQRNDIWSRNDQEQLIDSIFKGYPLPSFFLYQKNDGKYEMVDGQQRARTIFRFYKEKITDTAKRMFEDTNQDKFFDYVLSVTQITHIESNSELEEFYVLVNKKGKHLTTPELHKAEFAHTNFLSLVEELLYKQHLMDLNLFTDSASKRMNDRNFVEELVAYLLHGIQDKKKIIETIYKKDISEDEKEKLKKEFLDVIDIIWELNKKVAISSTRFKQRNDFYTLFNFINKYKEQSKEILVNQYKSFLRIAPFITPSVEDCPPLREYALNCVSQSNSKKAREARLEFFENILCNTSNDVSKNKDLANIADYVDRHELFEIDFIQIGDYYIIHP